MKKYIALVLAFSMLLCSCKKGDDSSAKDEIEVNTTIKVITTSPPETTTTTKNTEVITPEPAPDEPPCFSYNGKIHVITNTTYNLFYDGEIFEFDYSTLDGYKFLGTTYGSVDDPLDVLDDFRHYNFADGVPILYNSEKNSFLFWQQYGNSKVKILEHICDSSCYNIAIEDN